MKVARRTFLTLAGGAGVAAVGGAVLAADLAAEPAKPLAGRPAEEIRRAFVHNLHTGETLNAVYWESGRYVPDALAAAMRVMRDWRDGQEHVMAPRLFDLLHAIQSRLDVNRPMQLVSGYRSPATNRLLCAESGEVAAHSQHLLGKASDIRIEGVALNNLHRAALSLKAGGVGFYPQSDFVHVDVGPVRRWAGT